MSASSKDEVNFIAVDFDWIHRGVSSRDLYEEERYLITSLHSRLGTYAPRVF